MKLVKDVRPESVEGTWVAYPPEVRDENDKVVQEAGEIQLKIRPIGAQRALEIERKHLGSKRQFKVNERDGTRTVDVDLEAMDRVALEKAEFALLDSKNAEAEVGDEDAKKFYSKLLRRDVSVGDMVPLDGNWVPEVKQRVFREAHDLVAFVVVKATEFAQEKAADDAALTKRAS